MHFGYFISKPLRTLAAFDPVYTALKYVQGWESILWTEQIDSRKGMLESAVTPHFSVTGSCTELYMTVVLSVRHPCEDAAGYRRAGI